MDLMESNIYALICSNDGIKAKDMAKQLHTERKTINHYLYFSPYMKDLCYQDKSYCWHGYIRQTTPHVGLGDFGGYYGTVDEFLALDEDTWFEALQEGCRNIGRNLNDTRGLFHSFKDTRQTMISLFQDLGDLDYGKWEILFELRIKKSRRIRIYADVLVITDSHVFSLEFKMNDKIEPDDVSQAAKYTSYLEVLFGPNYDVVPALVLTRATDLFTFVPLPKTTAEIPVASGDMLFNVFDEYLGFLD